MRATGSLEYGSRLSSVVGEVVRQRTTYDAQWLLVMMQHTTDPDITMSGSVSYPRYFTGGRFRLREVLFAMNILLPVLVGALSAVGPPSLYSRVLRAQREVDEARALATIRVEATRRALDPESESVVRRSGET